VCTYTHTLHKLITNNYHPNTPFPHTHCPHEAMCNVSFIYIYVYFNTATSTHCSCVVYHDLINNTHKHIIHNIYMNIHTYTHTHTHTLHICVYIYIYIPYPSNMLSETFLVWDVVYLYTFLQDHEVQLQQPPIFIYMYINSHVSVRCIYTYNI
jgi:hypothetical protein